MTKQKLDSKDGLIEYLLDAITWGNRFDATFNQKLWAGNMANDEPESRDWTRQQVRDAFAAWTKEHEA